jgi:hypothetical protein
MALHVDLNLCHVRVALLALFRVAQNNSMS